jgi:biotin operon repressor
LSLNYQLQSGTPLIATHGLNRQKVNRLIQQNQQISQRGLAEKLNIGVATVREIIAGWGYTRPQTSAATSAAMENIRLKAQIW